MVAHFCFSTKRFCGRNNWQKLFLLIFVAGGGGGRPGQGELATISEAESGVRSGGGSHCWVRGGGGSGLDAGLVDHGGVLVDHGGAPGVAARANITVNPSDSPQSWTPLLQHLSQESNL